jgi:hypothetical protein
MRISNDQTYVKSKRIGLYLISSVLVLDLIKATFEGSLRESSWTLKILSGLKVQLISMFQFVSETLWPQFIAAWFVLDAYLLLLLGALALFHLMKGPFFVALEINDEVVLLENRWFKFLRRDRPGLFELQQMVPSNELRYVYMKKWLFLRFLCLDYLYEGEKRSLKFNVSRLNSEQRKNTMGKLRAVLHVHESSSKERDPRSPEVSEESMSKRSVLWKKVG